MNKGAESPECDECGCWIAILSINRDNQALNYRDVTWSVGIRCPAFRQLVHRVKASFLTRNDSRVENKFASSQRRFFSKIIPRLYIMSDIYIHTQNLVFHVHKELNSRAKIRDVKTTHIKYLGHFPSSAISLISLSEDDLMKI